MVVPLMVGADHSDSVDTISLRDDHRLRYLTAPARYPIYSLLYPRCGFFFVGWAERSEAHRLTLAIGLNVAGGLGANAP
jgi:hypothetical protein